MISSIYAGLLTLWLVKLSLAVIKLRTAKKVSIGDGGEPELQLAIRAQGNAAEYIPVAVILLVLLELNDVPDILLHAAGIAIVAGRILHTKGLLNDKLSLRVLGMKLTFFSLIAMALTNIVLAVAQQF